MYGGLYRGVELIEADRRELVGAFCRSCGYCMPCPAGIPINNANRITQLLQRSPWAGWITPEWQKQMEKIEDCVHCGACAKKCPYGLKPFGTPFALHGDGFSVSSAGAVTSFSGSVSSETLLTFISAPWNSGSRILTWIIPPSSVMI